MKLTISHVQTVKFQKIFIEKEHLNFLFQNLLLTTTYKKKTISNP